MADSFGMGIAASVQLREEVAHKIQNEINLLEKEKSAIDEVMKAQEQGSKKYRENAEKRKQIEIDILQKQIAQAQITKQLRDGWVSAIIAMDTGAGKFTKLLVSSTKAAGAALHLAGEAERGGGQAYHSRRGSIGVGWGGRGGEQATRFGTGGPGDLKGSKLMDMVNPAARVPGLSDLMKGNIESAGKKIPEALKGRVGRYLKAGGGFGGTGYPREAAISESANRIPAKFKNVRRGSTDNTTRQDSINAARQTNVGSFGGLGTTTPKAAVETTKATAAETAVAETAKAAQSAADAVNTNAKLSESINSGIIKIIDLMKKWQQESKIISKSVNKQEGKIDKGLTGDGDLGNLEKEKNKIQQRIQITKKQVALDKKMSSVDTSYLVNGDAREKNKKTLAGSQNKLEDLENKLSNKNNEIVGTKAAIYASKTAAAVTAPVGAGGIATGQVTQNNNIIINVDSKEKANEVYAVLKSQINTYSNVLESFASGEGGPRGKAQSSVLG